MVREPRGGVNRTFLSILQIVIFLLMLSVLVTFLNMLGIPNPFYNPFSRPAAMPRPVVPAPGDLGADERSTIEVFKQVSASVVFITQSALRRDLFDMNAEVRQGTGSGFIWDNQGHIVTNYHVIEGADSIDVTLSDHSVWRAHAVGGDPDTDLAVLRIGAPASKLPPIMIGAYKELQVGQKVLAIGNPFGLDSTLTVGVISALGRSIQSLTKRTITDAIQTDAAINPGNSGGPLLDSFGRLIGVNTAIISPSGFNAGIGFAVPIDTVNRIVPQLIAQGKVSKPYLGILLVPDHMLQQLRWKGAVIAEVFPNTPADKAGLQGTQRDERGFFIKGDSILKVDNEEIEDTDELLSLLARHEPGDQLNLTVQRGEEIFTVTVRLDVRSD